MLCFTLVLTGSLVSLSLAQSCQIESFDKAAADILMYGNSPVVPTDSVGLGAKCRSERRSLNIVQEYTDRCVSLMGRGLLQVFIDGASREIDKHCYEGPSMWRFLRLMPCMNEKAGAGIHRCNQELATVIQGIIGASSGSRIPLSCCILNEYVNCVSKQAAKCGPETKDFMREVVESYAGDLLETVCLRYKPHSRECRSLPRVAPTAALKYRSFLAPLSEVLEKRF